MIRDILVIAVFFALIGGLGFVLGAQTKEAPDMQELRKIIRLCYEVGVTPKECYSLIDGTFPGDRV